MISIQDLQAGARLRLTNEKIAEIVENPRDGMWLVVRDADGAASADGDEPEYLVHFSEVQSVET